MDVTFNSLTQWKVLPLIKAELGFSAIDKNFIFEYLQKGSFLTVTPVYASRKNMKGGNYIAALKVLCKIISIQSNIDDFQEALEAIVNHTITSMNCTFGYESQLLFSIEPEHGATVKDMTAEFNIGYADESQGPTITIDITGYLSRDILNSTNFSELFTKTWG